MATMQISRLQIVGLASIPIIGAFLNGFYNGPLYRIHPSLFWGADFALYALAPVAIVLWLAKSAKIYSKDYGLKFPPNGGFKTIATSVFFAVVLAAAYEIAKYIGWFFTWRWYVQPDFSYGAVTPTGMLRPLVVFYWALTAGLMESIFYIGLPWYLWRNHFFLAHRRRIFLFLTSAAFAAVHWEQGPHNVVAAFAFGVTACALYWKTNDLWPIVGAHTIVDFIIFL